MADVVAVNPLVAVSGNVDICGGTMPGTGWSVLQGLHIGQGVNVGGGAVVVKDVGDCLIVVGIPARPLGAR